MDSTSSPWPILRFLNEHAPIRKTLNRLPHWQQDGATYFLTFRLHDSIPSDILRQWREDRDIWLLEHPQPWSPETESEYHHRFSAAIDEHLDQGHGSCVLRECANASIVAQALQYFDTTRYLLHAWVIMPNHVHLLLSLAETTSLESIVASWKRFTAIQIHARNHTSGTLWQKDYFDRMIRDWEHFMHVARYIRRNPNKAGLAPGSVSLHLAPWVEQLLS
jgi:REP element-mobilizing transposase RayT